MSDETNETGTTTDYGAVRRALRAVLAERGHHLSSDSAGVHGSLYIMGRDDLARAVFEFKSSAGDAACELMYQGAWMPNMPPRFVVLPASEEHDPSLETLEQMRAMPLLYDDDAETITFRDLDQLMKTYVEVD
jgi:hypothetical protein